MTTHSRLRADQRPLYVQASEALKDLLNCGDYAAGDKLPSELELSQLWGISRPTLREALRLLEEQGAIVRKHGLGTFVASHQPRLEGGLEVLESIERMAERCGLATEVGDLSVEEREATPDELQGLGLQASHGVTTVTRVIMAGKQRVAHLMDVVPQEYLRQADFGADFGGSVLDLFLHRGWPILAHSRTDLAAEATGSDVARQLHVQRGAPLLVLKAQLCATDGRVVDYSISHFLPGYFRFHVMRRIG